MNRHLIWLALGLFSVALAGLVWPAEQRERHFGQRSIDSGKSIADTSIKWPSTEKLCRTLSLADYNTRVVLAGVTALGATGGIVGTFLLLRKRSLLSDTVSHCTLPGIAIAFLVSDAAGVGSRSLPLLLLGAATSGTIGMVAVAAIRARSRVKDDAALAVVLSSFFALGIALMVVIQQLPTGNAAGLAQFIYGKAASMTSNDASMILFASLGVSLVCVALFKEFKLLCFDAIFARTQGWPTMMLDLVLMGLVVMVTVVGLQAVGLLLVVAMLIIPVSASRFWTHRLEITLVLASLFGAASGFAGVIVSALFPKLPAGAVIVLVAVLCFALSFLCGSKRGLIRKWLEQLRVSQSVARQDLLRAVYEWCEDRRHRPTHDQNDFLDSPFPVAELRQANQWTDSRTNRLLRLGVARGLLIWNSTHPAARLTSLGKTEARRITRNHRLWEAYLLRYADLAPQQIHLGLDDIERVVDPGVMHELERLFAEPGGAALSMSGARELRLTHTEESRNL